MKDKEGNSALIFAAISGNSEIVKMLIMKGANLDIRDLSGKTALLWSIDKGNTQIAN
jgi:uncharacterized protein